MLLGNRDRASRSLLRFTSILLGCLVLVVALHHVAPHGGAEAGADHCNLCILLSSVLLVLPALAVLALAPSRVLPRLTAQFPICSRDVWTSWSHRGPPSLVS